MAESANPRVGRPSVAAERRSRIVAAFIELVGQRGLERVNLDDVASAAGVQLAAVRHFAGNRDDLITAAVAELCRRYESTVRTAASETPSATALIGVLFSDAWIRDQSVEDTAFDVLLGQALRNPETRGLIRGAYDLLLEEIALALRRFHPDTPISRVRDAAYVIACLVEQNTTFQHLGYPRVRHVAAKAAALRELADLGLQIRTH